MKKLMLGNEAVARGAYEAGVTVVSSYPGTPSTEITEETAKYDEIFSEWAPNEKVAAEVAIGASIGGARSMCAMKHVGLNVAADPIFTASYTGIGGGFMIAVADDPGIHSSQNEQDSRFYASGSKIPMLEPSDSQECLDFTKLAFDLSENCDTPVFLRLTTRVAHSRSIADIGERTDSKKEYVKNPGKHVMMPAMAKQRRIEIEGRNKKIIDFAKAKGINKMIKGDQKTGIITSGINFQYAKEAIPEASFLKLELVYPLDEELIRDFCKSVENVYVIEELGPYLEKNILSLGINLAQPEIFLPYGELSVAVIKEKIKNIKAEENGKNVTDAPVRPPVMCPGCPHRGTFYAIKKLGLNVAGDIGCYTLGALKPLEAINTCVCMGASIGMAHGIEKANGREEAKKWVAVIGDSTFIHSGITGLIDMVYNKGCGTVIILDNSITGMTGHQQNPATGYTIKNEPTKAVDLEMLAKAVGVNRVRTVDPFDIKETEQVIKEETAADEPSVIIARRPCALLKGVKFGNQVEISKDKCKNCKACMKIGCPAIVASSEGMTINEALCVGCGLCRKLCNFKAITEKGGTV